MILCIFLIERYETPSCKKATIMIAMATVYFEQVE